MASRSKRDHLDGWDEPSRRAPDPRGRVRSTGRARDGRGRSRPRSPASSTPPAWWPTRARRNPLRGCKCRSIANEASSLTARATPHDSRTAGSAMWASKTTSSAMAPAMVLMRGHCRGEGVLGGAPVTDRFNERRASLRLDADEPGRRSINPSRSRSRNPRHRLPMFRHRPPGQQSGPGDRRPFPRRSRMRWSSRPRA